MAHKDISCCNDHATLRHWKDSLKGAVNDYKICFEYNQYSVPDIIHTAAELCEELINAYCKDGTRVKGTLVAKVHYIRCTTEEEAVYYHTSAPCEEIINPLEFFERHMLRIANRIDTLNRHGSWLLIKHIEAIFVQLSSLDGISCKPI